MTVFLAAYEKYSLMCVGGGSKCQEEMIIQRVLKDLAGRAINSSSVR